MNTSQRFRVALKDAGPWLSLVLTFGAVAWLYFSGSPTGHVIGFAQGTPEAIAPIQIARVASVEVAVGDEVVAGQIVARLDTAEIDAEVALGEAEIARLEAEAHTEQVLMARRLDVDLEGLQREQARHREEQLRASAEAKVLDGEMSRVKALVADRQAVVGDLMQLDLQQATVAALVSEKPKTLDLLAKQIKAAEQRRQTATEPASAESSKFSADLLVARRNIERLQQQRAGYVLRATHSGSVVALDKVAGEVVAAAQRIVRLVSTQPRVTACVPERVALGLRTGDAARLWIRGQSGPSLRGKAIALGPVVAELPPRCWASPKLPVWGREVTIALDVPLQVIAGQAFEIVFESSHAAPVFAPPPPSPAAATNGASAMTVPQVLSQRSRFEPSGLIARPGESRYLVVSDDTGREADDGKAWLFAMSATGAVEPDPLWVSGVDELSDVEGITTGDAGEIYLLSSQSYSKKGRRKPARTALLRLRPEGQGFRVDGEVHLAELLDADAARAAKLGLSDGTRALDIEGLAFKQGALYLGLKAPLDAQGQAMIWRIPSPSALFEAAPPAANLLASDKGPKAEVDPKRLDASGIALWASARLDVELAGQPIPGGISELLFMPDGSLALASTPSTADGDAGAVWRVDAAASGALSPRLVQRFPGLKPEGLSPSLLPGKLMVVFDTGDRTPSFQELPWSP